MVVHTCDPSTQEAEAGGSGIQGSQKLCSKFDPEASLKYMRSYLRETKQKQKRRKGGGALTTVVTRMGIVNVSQPMCFFPPKKGDISTWTELNTNPPDAKPGYL